MAVAALRPAPREARMVEILDGVWASQIEKASPLPPRRDTLLQAIQVTRRWPIRVHGVRQSCLDNEHDWQRWVAGQYAALDLQLDICVFCGGVQVRDVSLDILVDRGADGRQLVLTPLRLARRKSDVLGHYSGRRPAGRVYL